MSRTGGDEKWGKRIEGAGKRGEGVGRVVEGKGGGGGGGAEEGLEHRGGEEG